MIARLSRAVRNYFASPFATSSADIDRHTAEEIEFHLFERTREGVASGLTEEQARRAALERFGDPAHVRRTCRELDRVDLLVCHHLHLLLTVGLLTALAAVLWTSRHQPAAVTIDPSLLPHFVERLASPSPSGDVVGRVVDERGLPVEGANVLIVVKTWPHGRFRQLPYTAVSAADGGFHLEDVYDPREQHAAQIAVVADHYVLKSSYKLQSHGELDPVLIALSASSGLDLRIEDESGNAGEGIEVVPFRRVDSAGEEHVVYFCSATPVTRTSDGDGRISLPYFNPGDTATLYVRVPLGGWETREIVVPPAGEIVTLQLENGHLKQTQGESPMKTHSQSLSLRPSVYAMTAVLGLVFGSTALEAAERADEKTLLVDSFEEGTDAPEGWSKGTTIPGVTYLWDGEQSSDGERSLGFRKSADRFFPIAAWSRSIKRTGDKPFVKVSAQVKAVNAKKAVIDVLFLDENDEWVKHQWAAYIGQKQPDDPVANHDWKSYSGTVEIPPQASQIVVGLQMYGSGEIWFDELKVTYMDAAPKSP